MGARESADDALKKFFKETKNENFKNKNNIIKNIFLKIKSYFYLCLFLFYS
jgi:hypothetical protein